MKSYMQILEKNNSIDASTRKKMRTAIQKVLKTTYFKQIPLQDLFDTMKKFGVVALQEDDTEWDGFLLGATGEVNFTLGDANEFEMVNGLKMYKPFTNVMLALQWYKMQSGKYEVTGYIT